MPVVKQDLSPHAMNCLSSIFHKPRPSQEINAGVCRQLTELRFAVYEQLPSPFASHKEGTKISHLVITDAGKTRVRKWGG